MMAFGWAARSRLFEQATAGQQPDSGVTVAELLARYMEVAGLDVSAKETCAGCIRRAILPALGAMELRKLRGPGDPHEPLRGAVAIDVSPACLVVEVLVR